MSADTTHPSTHLILAEQHLLQAVGYLVAVAFDADDHARVEGKRIAVAVGHELNAIYALRSYMSPSLTELLGAEPAENCS